MSPATVIMLPDWNTLHGGDTTYLQAHAAAARTAGYDIHLLSISDHDEDLSLPHAEIHHIRAHPRLHKGMWIPFLTPSLIRAAVKVASGSPDRPYIVHSFGTASATGVLITRRLRSLGIRAYSIHSSYCTYLDEKVSQWQGARHYSPGDRLVTVGLVLWAAVFIHWWERFGLRNADRVLVNYDCVAAKIRQTHGSSIPIYKITYTSAAPTGQAPSQRGDVPKILCVSRHDPRKGIDILIDALARLHQRRIPFQAHLVSVGPLLNQHRARVTALELDHVISLPGYVDNMDPYWGVADIFVLPSLREQSGSMSLLEAMWAGVAAVGAACDGISEDIVDEENGLLVPPGSAEALANALGRLLQDPTLRKRLANNARSTVTERFSHQALADALGREYGALRNVKT